MARKNQVEIVVNSRTEGEENLEKVARSLDDIAAKGGEGSQKAAELAAELRNLGQNQAIVNSFADLKHSTNELALKLEEAQNKALVMGKALSSISNPTRAMQRDFDSARKAVSDLEAQFLKQTSRLNETRNQLQKAGMSAKDLAAHDRVLKLEIERLTAASAKLINEQKKSGNVLNQVSSATKQATQATKQFKNTTDELSESHKKESTSQQMSASWLGKVRMGYLMVVAAIGGTIKKVWDITIEFDSMTRSLKAITGSSAAAAREMLFIKRTSDVLGISVRETGKAYIGFMAATKGTAIAGKETQRIFVSVSRAMSALGKSSEDTSGALLALQQMVSKGTVQSEELRGQLGERLPGAYKMLADAMGVTTQELNKMLENGQVLAEDVLPLLREQLDKVYGSADLSGNISDINKLKNVWDSFANEVGVVLIPILIDGLKLLTLCFTSVTGTIKLFNDTINASAEALKKFDVAHPIDSLKKMGNAFLEAAAKGAIDLKGQLTGLNSSLGALGDNSKDAKNKSDALNQSLDGTGESAKHANESLSQTGAIAGAAINSVVGLTDAQKELAKAQSQLRIDLDKEFVLIKQSNVALEKKAKANLETAKSEKEIAEIKQDQNAAVEAGVKVAQAELDVSQLKIKTITDEIGIRQKKKFSLEQEFLITGKLSEGKQDALDKITLEIEALKAERLAHDASAESAKAHKDEVDKSATAIERAFARLNLLSLAKQKDRLNEAKQAYEDLSKAASDGIVSQEDAKQAFMAYAKEVVDQSKNAASAQVKAKNDMAMANLRAKAETMGLGTEFAKLEGVATQAGDVASASMDKIAKSSKDAADSVAGIGNFLEENMVRSTTEVTKLVPVIVAQAASQINSLGEKARDEFVKMHGDLDGLIEKGTAADDIEAMTSRIGQLRSEMSTLAHYSVRTGDHIGDIAAAAKGAEVAVLEQKIALAQMTEQMQRTNGEAQKVPISLESISARFDKLDDADLSNLRSEIQRINGELEETKNAAKDATEQLEDMINAAKDDLDRDNGNFEAIEKRRLAKEMAKIDAETAKGGDQAKAAELKSLLQHASKKRLIAEQERKKEEKAREKEQAEQKRKQEQAERAAQSESKKQSSNSESGSSVSSNRASSQSQSSDQDKQVVRVVRIELPDVGGAMHLSEDEAALFERWEKQFVDKLNRQSRISM